MAKENFTPGGVVKKQTDLYALTDGQLAIEADAVLNDFNNWVRLNFDLSPLQVEYLEDFDLPMQKHLGSQLCIAFLNRLPITLKVPPNYPVPDVRIGKWFHDRSNLIVGIMPPSRPTATGELIYEISYS